MNYLLSFALINEETPFGDRLSLSITSALIGIGVVFCVLALLIGAIYLFNFILNKLENKPKQKEEKVAYAPIVEATEPTVTANLEDNSKIIAVITAALTVAAFDKPNARFIVKKIKKL